MAKTLTNSPSANPEDPLNTTLQPLDREKQGFGSTDVGDVSWVCPTAQILTAAVAKGTPAHSWQWTAQCKTDLARETTLYAAKVLAAAAVELMEDPELLQKAKDDHARRVGPNGYICPIPEGAKPISLDSLRK
jgi:aminobenzoyl-glutamate utilization protein B